MKITISILTILVLVSCSSRTLKKDYKVIDASQQDIPKWLNELEEWLEGQDTKKQRFYSYTSEAKNSRAIACEIAKTKSMALIAQELSTFIKQSFVQSSEGDPTSSDEKLSEYVSNTLEKDVKATISGARTYKTYWEKRRFQKDLGASKDYEGYVCSALTKIAKKNLKKAFARVQSKIERKSENESRKQVKMILDKASSSL